MDVLFLLKPDVSHAEAQGFIDILLKNGGVVSNFLSPRVVIATFADPPFPPAVLLHHALAFHTQQAVSSDVIQYLASEDEKKMFLQWNQSLQDDKKRIGADLNWNHPGFSPPDKPPH